MRLLDLAGADKGPGPAELGQFLLAQGWDQVSISAVVGAAKRLQDDVSRARRRDRELAALFSSARELAELRDVDQLVARLVERGHDLVGTDLTYLSEFDAETGRLHVRATQGVVSPAFRGLTVPPGIGLAALVARTRTAHWTANYAEMLDVDHERTIDSAVASEGIVALVGVPLIAGSDVLGVLFAGNRFEYVFTPDEVALLTAFADNVSVVLQTARLLADARRAAEERSVAYAALSEHVAAMERAGQVHERLTAAVLHSGTADDVARTLSAALSREVVIVDESLEVLASTGSADRPVQLPPDVTDALAEGRRTGRMSTVAAADGTPRFVAAVVASGTLLGGVLLGPGGIALGAVEQRTVERAAQITALLRLQHEAVARAENQVRGELLADLVEGEPNRGAHIRQRLRARGLSPEGLGTLTIVALEPRLRERQLARLHAATDLITIAGEIDSTLVALSSARSALEAAALVSGIIEPSCRSQALVVSTEPAAQPYQLPRRYRQARDALRVLQALGTTHGTYSAAQLEPYTAMFGPNPEGALRFIDDTIGPLLSWDRDRHADLVRTVAAYLDKGASPARAARHLTVHTNTVLQRLERVDALLGPQWRAPEQLFRVHVALRLHLVAQLDAQS